MISMKTGIEVAMTTDYAGESKSTEGVCETLRKIAQAGFTHIHWCHEWDGDYTYSLAEMYQIRGWMNDLGLKCKGLHATEGSRRNLERQNPFHYRFTQHDRRDYTSENEYNRQAGVELIRNRVRMAEILGTDAIVLHMQLPYKEFEADEQMKERYYCQVFKSFDELEEECRRRKVRICVENMIGTPEAYQMEQFDRLFDRYSPDYMGFTYDCGHGAISGNGLFGLAERYRDRIYMIHLHDNHGLASEECWEDAEKMCRCDEHNNLWNGVVDFEKLAEILAGSPYELPVVLEVSAHGQEEMQFLKESMEAGVKMTEMIRRFREDAERGV